MKPKVLVIDTHWHIQLIRERLSSRADDWEVLFTSDPKAAMKTLESGTVNVVLCGSHVQGLNCFSFPHEINKLFERINVIILNLNGQEIPREKYLRTTAFDIVQMDDGELTSERILESIEIAITAKRMEDTGTFVRPKF